MNGIKTIKAVRRILMPVFAALIFAFAFSDVDAQIRPYGNSFLGGVNVPVSVTASETIRIRIAVPDDGGSRATGSAHVKVFDGRSVMLFESSIAALPGGAVHEFEIDPLTLQTIADPLTGRIILRLKVELSLRNAAIDSDSIEFPTMFELVDRESDKAILIGLLLPAIQK